MERVFADANSASEAAPRARGQRRRPHRHIRKNPPRISPSTAVDDDASLTKFIQSAISVVATDPTFVDKLLQTARLFHEAGDVSMLALSVQIIDALACTASGRRWMMNSDGAGIFALLAKHTDDTIRSPAQRIKDRLISHARKELGVK